MQKKKAPEKKIQLTKESLANHGKYFAITTNNDAWRLSEKASTELEKEAVLAQAFASLYHWRKVGKPANVYMAYVIVARALAINGAGELALEYAEKSLNFFDGKGEEWIQAFCNLMVANAYSVMGKKRNFKKYWAIAEEIGGKLNEKEQKVFNATKNTIEQI